MKQTIIKVAIAFGLLIIALIYFIIVQAGLAFIIDSMSSLESRLFVESLAKPVGLTAIGIWLLLLGKYLKAPKAFSWGKLLLMLYVIAALAPYFLSFLMP